jgi:hypothetical protein
MQRSNSQKYVDATDDGNSVIFIIIYLTAIGF